MTLRDYQTTAISKINSSLSEFASTLLIMATGTGKTVVFTHLAHNRAKRVLILAHRKELIEQAASKVLASTGERPAIEMASSYSDEYSAYGTSKVVVASVQTMIAGHAGKKRMDRFRPGDFDLVVIDEAHHSTANSYREIIHYFTHANPECRILGVTATPDRADKTRLGDIFKSVAFDYGLVPAIEDGFLVPINQHIVDIESLSFDGVKSRGGDFIDADLAKVMNTEKVLHGVVTPSIQLCEGKQTVVFAASVDNAERIAEIWNRHKPGSARSISGEMPKDERTHLLAAFARGDFQVLTSCMVLVEGWDCPEVQAIVVARPTKARSLYAQMLGRGTRPLTGIVDGCDSSMERHAAISASEKNEILVLDFAGNSTRHKLVCSIDLLAGNASEKTIERAKKAARKGGRAQEIIEDADEHEKKLAEARDKRLKKTQEERRSSVTASGTWKTTAIDPFALGISMPEKSRPFSGDKPLTDRMAATLQKNGLNPAEFSYSGAGAVIGEITRRRQGGLATMKQCKWLNKFGMSTDVSMAEASRLLSARWGNKK